MKTRETVYNCQDSDVAVCGNECVRTTRPRNTIEAMQDTY